MNEKASGEDRRGIDDLTLNRLREKARKLKRERGISHGKALEEVAREAGFQSWHKATLSLPEGGHRTEPDGDEAGKTAAEAVPGAGREAKARRSEAHSDCPWEREKAEATRVLVACGNGFDHMSEAFQLLMARFLERWDNGVPISMMPGATGAIPYLVAECLGDLAARGVTTPASQVTLGIILERGATDRQGEKPMDAAEFIRLVIVHNGFQELAMTAGSGWRRDGSACPERRFRLVYDAWMKSEAVEQEVVYEMMRGLVSHASGMSVTGMIMLKRQASGFYGNADFPVTPPMNYDAKDIQTVAVKVGRNETLTFLWAENNSSDHYRVAVCDWNAKLTDTQTGRLKA